MKNKHQFQQAVTTASRVLGGNLGAKVVFSGDQAKTDGKTITIPQLPENAMINEHEEAITTGYYCHESAHIRYSEMDYLLNEMTEAAQNKDELFKSLINAVEDCYIEREWTDEYEGSKNPLSDAHRTVDTKALTYMAQDEAHASDFRHIGPMGLTWMSGREKGYDGVVRERCIKELGEGMEQKLHDWYEKYVKPVKSSRDSVKAARVIADEMVEYQKQQEQEQEQSEQGQPEEQQCDGGQGDGETTEVQVELDPTGIETTGQSEDGEKPTEDVSQGKHGDGDQPDDNGDVTGQGDGEGGDLTKASEEPVVPMPVDIDIREALDVDAKRKDGENNQGKSLHYMPMFEEFDTILTRRQDAPSVTSDLYKWEAVFHDGDRRGRRFKTGQSAYNKMLSETHGTLSVMRRKIQRAFMAKMNREWTGGHETGRLNPRDLVRAYQGVDKVYRQRSDAPDIDTSVQILVDASSSMNGPRMRCAAVTSIALCQTLDAIGCETEVITFDGIVSDDAWTSEERQQSYDLDHGHCYTRLYPMSLVAHKEFDEPIRQVQTALGNMLVMPDGGTPTGDAIMLSYKRLLARPSARKIMLLVTDGMANNQQLCKQVIKHVQQKGVEIAGIGIGGDYIGNWCDKSITVRHVDDLASKVMDDFAKMLLGERFNASNVKGEAA